MLAPRPTHEGRGRCNFNVKPLLGPFVGSLGPVAGRTMFLGTPLLLCCQLGRACGACREFSRVASTFSAAACFAIACGTLGTRMLRCLAFSNDPHRPCIRHTQTCVITSLGGPHWAASEGRWAHHRNGTHSGSLKWSPLGRIGLGSMAYGFVCLPRPIQVWGTQKNGLYDPMSTC